MSKEKILSILNNKQILILGFGKEGKSTYRFLCEHIPYAIINIADKNAEAYDSEIIQEKHRFLSGNDYLNHIKSHDIIIKSPGISLKNHSHLIKNKTITSQTDLFLRAYAKQCIGITGTKGKTTTASFIYHVLQKLHIPSLIAGNMGIPLFDILPQISEKDRIILELSSHQLEFIQKSPSISLLLNLFEEHLDHYHSFYDYQLAKLNIASYQQNEDIFIYNTSDSLINEHLKKAAYIAQRKGFSYYPHPHSVCYIKENQFVFKPQEEEIFLFELNHNFPLKGKHNIQNCCAGLLAVLLAENISDYKLLKEAFYSFQSLPHRLEYVATINGVAFYNDSISTIPQATLAALEAIDNVNTLILGGMDRGIDYSSLVHVFIHSNVEHFIFTGKAGERMMKLCDFPLHKKFYFSNDYKEIIAIAQKHTRQGCSCLLSPAAPSYDAFKNFEERGDVFKQYVLLLQK